VKEVSLTASLSRGSNPPTLPFPSERESWGTGEPVSIGSECARDLCSLSLSQFEGCARASEAS
jgi:hypothetical protein